MNEVVVDTKTESNQRGMKFRRLILPASMVLGLVAVIAIGAFLYFQKTEQAKRDAQKPQTLQSSYDTTTKKLESKLNKAKTSAEKSNVYVEMANAEQLIGRHEQAVSLAKKAISTNESIAAYAALGIAAMQSGDKATAAEAYGKAAELARKSGTPQAEQTAKSYEIMKAEVMQ